MWFDLGIPLPPFFEGISLRPFIETNTQFSRVLFAGETLYFNSHAIIQNNQDLRSAWLTRHDPWIPEFSSQIVGE